MFEYMMIGEGLSIRLEVKPVGGEPGDFSQFDLLRRAIVELIERFDTHHAEKADPGWNTSDFYASLLSVIARHYMVDAIDDPVADGQIPVHEVLADLIAALRREGKLLEEVGAFSDED